MEIDLQTLSPRDVYGFMIQAIVPRPIAWVLSDNGNGSYNLAPFSYFNGVASRPPTLSISIGKKRDRSKKDTWRNIEERNHFVVHIACADMAPLVSATSASLPFGRSEVEENEVALATEPDWSLPRVAQAKIAMLCERHQIVEIGEGPQGLVIGRITRVFLSDEIAQPKEGKLMISAKDLAPLARLGGDDFASITPPFSVARPE